MELIKPVLEKLKAIGMPDKTGTEFFVWHIENAEKINELFPNGIAEIETENGKYAFAVDSIPQILQNAKGRKERAVKPEAIIYQEMFIRLGKMSPEELKLRRDILKSALLHNKQYEDARNEHVTGDDMTELKHAESRFEHFCAVHGLSHIHYIRKELGLINENFYKHD